MPKHYWIIAAALGLIIVAAVAYGTWISMSVYKHEHAKERYSVSEYENKSVGDNFKFCRAIMQDSGLVDWFTCLAETISAPSGAKQAEYDLKAQQDMAEWAFGMFIVSVLTTVISVIGLAIIWSTLISANATNREAIRANEIMLKDQRPWLKVSFDIPGGINFQNGKGECWVSVYCENIGGRPAINGQFRAIAYCPDTCDEMGMGPDFKTEFQKFIDIGKRWYRNDTKSETDRGTNTAVIFPNEKLQSSQLSKGYFGPISGKEIKIIYIFVMAIYVDPVALKDVHITAQCYRITSFEIENHTAENGEVFEFDAPAIPGKIYQMSDLYVSTGWLPNEIT